MNVEPQTHGLPDWHFPSPSSTPRSTSLHQAPFQTPKCEASSHFQDAYYTPQITGHQTPAVTPTYQNFTVVKRPALPSPLTPNDPTFHVNHFKGPNLPLPPVEPARRLSSSPDPIASSNTLQRTLSVPKLRAEGQMDHFQMQTPPPTRDSSSRRESYNGQQVPPNPPSNGFHGQASTPIRPPQPNLQQTPHFQTPYHQYSQLQFSPEMFQYGGPASAPPMPHTRYPWDQSPTMASFGNNGMMDAQHHPFGPGTQFNNAFQDWQSQQHVSPMQQQGGFQELQHQQQHQQQHQNALPMDQSNQMPDFWTTPGMTQLSQSFSQETSSFASTTTAVNPSMIFSFSSPPQTVDPASVRPQLTQKTVDTGGRLPYEHQMRESSREKEIAATKKAKLVPTRTSSASSSISLQSNARPGLQRSNTDSGFRRVSNRSIDSQKALHAIENITRRASPLKRNSQISLMAIPEAVRPRPRTRLVIDDSGRARTETLPADEQPPVDPRKSIGFWVDDDDDSDEDVGITSQRNSFAFPSDHQLKRRSSKHARTDSDPDRFDPSKRPVSSASMASLASRLENTPIGKRSSVNSNSNYRRFSSGSFAGSLSGDIMRSSKEISMEEDSTDAQGALKKLMEGRRRNEQINPRAVLDAHNQRWSQASIDLAKFSAMQEQMQQQDPYNQSNMFSNSTLSPTSASTDEFVPTPSTSRSTHSNDSTRCVCNNNDASDEQLFIQCESCTKWLHVRCVGLHPNSLPPVYVCLFCTGSTPLVRGGRVREPLRREGRDSPLGYKSGGYRR